jgi:hypothetical protein
MIAVEVLELYRASFRMKCTPAEAAMSVKCCSYLAISLLAVGICGTLSAQQPSAPGQSSAVEVTPPSAVSNAVVPQIVRLSYVEGDVRVSRGKLGKHDGGAAWEQAAVNLPLETGFSLVTGKGRAEIEFEDASTMYLDDNSVLTFDNLTTKENVPHTEMALLTGTATLHLRPTVQGEMYFLKTPTDSMNVPYGAKAYLRVNSYLDAMTLTPQESSSIRLGHLQTVSAAPETSFTYRYGVAMKATKLPTKDDVAFDTWVAQRVASRATAMAAVMKEAGLDEPLPGLADMNAQGKFFPCEPYGTCWEPNNGWGKPQAGQGAGQQTAGQPASTQTASTLQNTNQQNATVPPNQQATGQAPVGQDAQGGGPIVIGSGGQGGVPILDADVLYADAYAFPCSPYGYGLGDFWLDDPANQDLLENSNFLWSGNGYNFNWAACHAGSWIRYGRRYAWVVGGRKHHHCPVHWVKVNGKLGFVPIHPKDVAGKEPLNLKHGIFVPVDKKAGDVRLITYEPGKHVEVLAETPKQFRQPALPVLRAAAAPNVEAHLFRDTLPGVKVADAARPLNTIAFDHRSQSFTLVTRVTEGGRSSTFTNPMGGRVGSSQPSGPMVRGGGYSGGSGGSHGGYSGGSAGSHGGSSGGGSSGGSHASSGGGSSSSAGSSSGGSSSSAGSSSAGHK